MWILIWQHFFYGKCCSSKTISARKSADGYKSPQCDALRFIICRRRCRLFVAFSEREPFSRGFLCGSCGSFLPKSCIWVSRNVQKVSWDSDRWFGFVTRNSFDSSSKSTLKQCTINGATRMCSIVKTTWTSWMGFGPVEWSGWGLVVIPAIW